MADERPAMPPASFQTLVALLASQAMHALGLMAEPGKEPPKPDLEHARFVIDLLGVLQEKTKASLDPAEASMLQGVLTDLRMAFVRSQPA